MSAVASNEALASALQSPLWGSLLDTIDARICGAGQGPLWGRSSRASLSRSLARAHSLALISLEGGSNCDASAASLLTAEAVDLLTAVARLSSTVGERPGDDRKVLVDMLRRRLSSHERAVLAGEVTYAVWDEQADEPSVRMRHAISRLTPASESLAAELLSLRVGATDLASILVRLAANVAMSGNPREAPEAATRALDHTLHSVTREVASRATSVELPVADRADVVAHHLAAGLRVHAGADGISAGSHARSLSVPSHPAAIAEIRDAWVQLATHERVAVTALDARLPRPTYRARFASLSAAMVEGAANLICGTRLLSRPGDFGRCRAWRHQAVGLTYALEAYVAGVGGDSASLAQAQQIALTRLVRATVAIALIDLDASNAAVSPPEDLTSRASG